MGSIPTNRQPHVKAYISRPDGLTWEDVSSYLRSVSIECGNIEQVGTQASGADGAIRRLTLVLQNEGAMVPLWDENTTQDENYVIGDENDAIGDEEDSARLYINKLFGTENQWDRASFSPSDRNSPWNQFNGQYSPLLWSNRQIEIQAAVTARGEQPSSMLSLFRGYLGERISTEGGTVECSARDLVKRLQNKFIVTKRTYGSNTETIPMETVAQQILDDNFGIGVITLNCPVPTGRGVKEYELVDLSVWDALVQLTNPWGGWLGYRWNIAAGEWQLTLMQPPRDKGPDNPDFIFDASDIYVEQLETSDEDIRNLVVVEYFDDATQQIESVTVQDNASIAEFDERAMKIRTERLHTEADALALAQAALHDMAGYPATVHLNIPFTPEMDVFDGILVTNPRISSTQDFYGVISVRHDLAWGDDGKATLRTDVIATGRVTGGHQRWLDMSTSPGAPGRPQYPANQDNPATPAWDTCEFGREITLRWFAVPGAVEYEVQRSGSSAVWRGNATTLTLAPIGRSETFYLRAINSAKRYSEAAEITLTNATPTTPPQPLVTEFFTALWVEIQPVADNDIIGYTLYLTPVNETDTPIGPAQVETVPYAQRKTVAAASGSRFKIEVSASDALGEGGKSLPLYAQTAFIDENDLPDEVIKARHLTTGELITLAAQIKHGIIDSAHIRELVAEEIEAGQGISAVGGKMRMNGAGLVQKDAEGTERVRVGDLSGCIWEGNPLPAGTYGIWTNNGYFSGQLAAKIVTAQSLRLTDTAIVQSSEVVDVLMSAEQLDMAQVYSSGSGVWFALPNTGGDVNLFIKETVHRWDGEPMETWRRFTQFIEARVANLRLFNGTGTAISFKYRIKAFYLANGQVESTLFEESSYSSSARNNTVLFQPAQHVAYKENETIRLVLQCAVQFTGAVYYKFDSFTGKCNRTMALVPQG